MHAIILPWNQSMKAEKRMYISNMYSCRWIRFKTGQLLINKCLHCQGQAIGSESIIFCYFLSQYAANSLFHVSFPMVHKYNINFTWVSLSSASWNCLAMRRKRRNFGVTLSYSPSSVVCSKTNMAGCTRVRNILSP